MNDSDTKKFRNISEKVQGKYTPVIKFGGTNKYINRNYTNDSDATNGISFTGDEFNSKSVDIYYDNKYGVNRVCFSPQGKYVAGCGTNGIIYVYDLYENKLLTKICTKIDNIRDLTISDNDKYIYACGDNKIIEIFDLYESKKKVFNDDVARYVDVSIPSIIKSQNGKREDCAVGRSGHNGGSDETGQGQLPLKGGRRNPLDNIYAPWMKVKHRDFTHNKVVYVPVYNYSDLIKSNINMVDLNCIKMRKVNPVINKSLFIIKDSHECSTSCLAVPNVSTFLVYSGGGDGLLKIWDIRMNMFTLHKKGNNKKGTSNVIFLDNKNPYASICSHEDILTSINFNNTIDHEGAYKMRRAERKREMRARERRQRAANGNNSQMEKEPHSGKTEQSASFENEKLFLDDEGNNSSFSSSCSSVSYSSITFNLTRNKFNNILMTSGYDGYIRLYDINNNIIKSFYDEEKSITHCMFSYNNKYIISTNKSKYAKIFDFIYMNNKKNAKNMVTYLSNYQSYHLNKPSGDNPEGEDDNEYGNCAKLYDDNFSKDIYSDKEFQPCNIKNIYEDKELEERIKLVNELNRKISKEDKKKAAGEGANKVANQVANGVDNGVEHESDGTYSNTDSSVFDENTIKTNTFYEHVNKKLEPTWSLFLDNMKYMNLIPYDELNESLRRNHEYVKAHYKKLNHSSGKSNYNQGEANSAKQIYHPGKDEKEHMLYYEMSDIINNETDIPNFYSCVAGDKCIIPSVDTYAHVYDIYTGFHVNTISNLYLPNYHHNDSSYFDSSSTHQPFFKKRHLSFLTSADTYPKNQNIIATSNGYPDGSIVLWVFAPF
ncbi:WD domain, G-beta repeat domain-containing protein [Plasmodium vivax Brazil I]|uniref:WD domain, G-beta repeat domain-containing protein n=1 Tax=Plasmodium vivax (strain Brazil I) TaxID=1033975 RepID=A0A0J9SWA4_PLAV1|nr:WD domain, G-beta repeat domain-containing protein [Plasmodium vivax Brazil I]